MNLRLRHLPAYGRYLVLTAVLTALTIGAGCSERQPATLTIAYSNDLKGEIRSCGCPVNDFGGLGRRATLLETVRDSTENFLLVDAGDFFSRELNYGKEKADLTMKSMAWMGYHAVVIGEKDFGFGVEYIVRRTEEIGLPVIAANLYDATADTLLFPPSWVVEYPSGLSVGLIGVLDPRLRMPTQVPKGSIRISDPVGAVKRELEVFGDAVEMVVVVAHMNRREAQALAVEVPDVDVVVHGHEGKPMRKNRRFGNAFLLQNSEKGLYMGVAFAVLDGRGGVETLDSHLLPLSKEYEDHEAIAKLFRSYDMSVAAKEKSNLPPAFYEARAGLKKPFAGSSSCKECHEDEFVVWESSKHAHAFATLEAQTRQYDRDCTPCHTTGFYKLGGFEHLSVTPDLVDVGCESCHGNGHEHVRDPAKPFEDDALKSCQGCHNTDQSPDFDFDTEWVRIQH